MVSFLVVFRELAIVRKPLLINKDGIFGRDRGPFKHFSKIGRSKNNCSNALISTYITCSFSDIAPEAIVASRNPIYKVSTEALNFPFKGVCRS